MSMEWGRGGRRRGQAPGAERLAYEPGAERRREKGRRRTCSFFGRTFRTDASKSPPRPLRTQQKVVSLEGGVAVGIAMQCAEFEGLRRVFLGAFGERRSK